MAADYKLDPIDTNILKLILLADNIVLICLGVVHWGYCGVGENMLSLQSSPQVISMVRPHNIYFIFCGIQQILVSAYTILFLLQIIGQTNKRLWVKLLLIGVFVDFGFNFAAAVSTGLHGTNLGTYFQAQIKNTSGHYSVFQLSVKSYYGYTIAEAVLTFVLAIILIVFNFICFATPIIAQESPAIPPPPMTASNVVTASNVYLQNRNNP